MDVTFEVKRTGLPERFRENLSKDKERWHRILGVGTYQVVCCPLCKQPFTAVKIVYSAPVGPFPFMHRADIDLSLRCFHCSLEVGGIAEAVKIEETPPRVKILAEAFFLTSEEWEIH